MSLKRKILRDGTLTLNSHSADPNVPNVIVTRLTLVCSTAPGPLELDLTGEWVLESLGGASWHLASTPKNNFLH